jgi:C-terminal processing protease CtpA/Prc
MRFARTVLIGLGLLAAAAAPAAAQEQDKEALKKKILEEVERRLRQEEERLLKDIEKVIEEELAGARKGPAPESKPPAAPRAKARGYLGIRPGDLSDAEKKDLGIQNGIRIFEVVEGGPAAKAGLKADDVLTAIDGKPIDSPQEVPALIQNLGEGARIQVEYLRNGRRSVAEVTLGRHPMDAPAAEADPKKEAPRPAEPPREQPPKEEPKKEELRERVKKFLERREGERRQEEPPGRKPGAPSEDDGFDFFALEDEVFEQLRAVFEQLGMDPEQFFEQGKDGKWRLNRDLRQMFRGLNLEKFRDLLPGKEAPAPRAKPHARPAPKPEPRKEAPAPPPAPRAWMGLQPEELSEQLRAQLEIEEGVGLLVADVVAGSPAEQAGLRKNDILLKIDGRPVRGEEGLAKFMEAAKPGQEATLTILRRGKEQALKVKLGERKAE